MKRAVAIVLPKLKRKNKIRCYTKRSSKRWNQNVYKCIHTNEKNMFPSLLFSRLTVFLRAFLSESDERENFFFFLKWPFLNYIKYLFHLFDAEFKWRFELSCNRKKGYIISSLTEGRKRWRVNWSAWSIEIIFIFSNNWNQWKWILSTKKSIQCTNIPLMKIKSTPFQNFPLLSNKPYNNNNAHQHPTQFT